MSNTIRCDIERAADVVGGLAALSAMAGTYASFTVETGQSLGYPADAFTSVAAQLAGVARAEQALIDKIIANITADVASYMAVDEAAARLMLGIGE